MSDKITKKQHYVPQFYIKNFYNSKGRVDCCFLKDFSVVPIRSENICCENYLYEVDKEDPIYSWEIFFNSVEGLIKQDIDRLIKFLDGYNLQSDARLIFPRPKYLKDIIEYVVIQKVRTPRIVNNLGPKVQKILKHFKDYYTSGYDKMTDSDLKAYGLAMLFAKNGLVNDIFKQLERTHNVVVLKSSKLPFLSGDEAVIGDYKGRSELDDGMTSSFFSNSDLYFPLNTEYCLALLKEVEDFEYMSADKMGFKLVDDALYDHILKRLVVGCDICVFSNKIEDEVLDRLKNFSLKKAGVE